MKLALILPGGASLGSFEAGVVYQLLEAVNLPGSKLEIDVISGASAGAIVGAATAKVISGGLSPELLKGWTKITIDCLQKNYYKHEQGLLSSREFRKILQKILLEPTVDSESNKDVVLSINVTDLVGELKQSFHFGFPITELVNKERIVFTLNRHTPKETWEQLAETVRASAAFPTMFAPSKIGEKIYSDGGIVENEPVKGAIISLMGRDQPFYDPERLVLFIDPYPSSPPVGKISGNIVNTLLRVLQIMIYKPPLADFAQAQKTNERILYLFKSLTGLTEALLQGNTVSKGWPKEKGFPADKGCEGNSDVQVDKFYAGVHRDGDRLIDTWINRLITNYNQLDTEKQEYVKLVHRELLGLMNLPHCRWLAIERIAPENLEDIAGEGLFHFFGFFRQSFLENDFEAGRRAGRKWLQEKLAVETSPGKTLHEGNATWKDLTLREKTRFIRLLARLMRLLIGI